MSFLFSPPSPSAAPKALIPPQKSDAEIQGAASDERRRLAAATGRATTLLTQPADSTLAPSGAKTLLGAA